MTEARWSLAAKTSSAKAARAAIRDFLVGSHASAEERDAVTLVANELVANAILHAAGAVGQIELRIDDRPRVIHIEVHDGDPTPPTLRQDRIDDEGGRGLVIVDHIATRWGWDDIAGDGKRVWCDVTKGPRWNRID